MVLSRLTKITGPGVATDTNWVGNNADFTGITTTATSFNIGVTTIHSNLIEAHNIKSTGIITATGGSFSGNVTAVDGTFSGNVSIAGTLTYEDVTNIDAVGIITAPALDVDDFLDVGSNIKLGNAGVITATSFVGSGAALTGIDATAIKDSGGNVKIQAQASGAIHSGVSTFQDIDVDGHTNLDNVSIAGITTTTENIRIQGDNKYLTIGAGNDIGLVHTGGESFITNATGHLTHRCDVHKWENFAGSAEYLRIDSSGNVLVGTTDSTIYNNGDSASEGIVLRNGEVIDIARKGDLQLTLNRQTNDGPHIAFYRSGSVKSFISTRNNAFCIDDSSGNEKFRIDSSGRLFTGGSTQVLDSTTGTLHLHGGTAGGRIAFRGTTTSANAGLAEVFAFWDTNKVAGMIAKSGTDTTNKDDGSLHFYTNTGSGISERLRILSSGELRIISSGSNNDPAHLRLHCEDTSIVANDGIGQIRFAGRDAGGAAVSRTGALIQATAANDWDTLQSTGYSATHLDFFTQANAGADTVAAGARLRIASDGKVGINQSSPTAMLEVVDSAYNQLYVKGSSTVAGIRFGNSAHTNGYIYYDNGPNMLFNVAGAEKARITSNGHLRTQGNNTGNPVGMELRNNNTAAYSHAELSLTSQNATTSKIWCDVPNAGMRLQYNGGTTVKVNQSGNLVMGNGSGIDFSATANSSGSMGSELLDDYEEGSWTPALPSGGTATTLAGQYTKIGNKVFWAAQIQGLGGSASFRLSGLPYFVNAGWGGGISISDNNHSPEEIYVFAHVSSSDIYFRNDQNGTFNVSTFAGHFFYIHGFYQTNS